VFSISSNLFAQGDAKAASENIIKAYKNKDLKLLKEYATGVLLYSLNDGFFESSEAKPLVEMAKSWDGKIREIRYSSGNMMGKFILLANVYFGDNPNGNINTVLLTSFEKADWKAFGLGISDMSKDEFMKGSKDIPEDKPAAKPKAKDAVGNDGVYKGFSVEMASGETYENPTIEKLKASLKSINDDNFFLILNSKEGFLQTTISEKGYIVQHNHGGGMFEAESFFTFDKLVEIFSAYLKDEDWKGMDKWVSM
jgi:hypothetical protein